MLDLFSGLVEHGHAFAGEVEIALGVERHAVRAEFAAQAFVRQRAVRLDVVGVGFARLDVGHEKRFAVRRADDAVGLDEIGRHALERFAVGAQEINLLAVPCGGLS